MYLFIFFMYYLLDLFTHSFNYSSIDIYSIFYSLIIYLHPVIYHLYIDAIVYLSFTFIYLFIYQIVILRL